MSCTIAEVKRQLESVTEKIQNIHNLLDSCKELKKHRFTIKLVKSDDAFNSTPSRILNARGNVTLPYVPTESPPSGSDLNRQRSKSKSRSLRTASLRVGGKRRKTHRNTPLPF